MMTKVQLIQHERIHLVKQMMLFGEHRMRHQSLISVREPLVNFHQAVVHRA